VQNVATGQYLNNARVTVKGSNNTVFTDKDGTYRLVNVPSGPATLEVFFTDLDLSTVQVNVPAGGLATQDVKRQQAGHGQPQSDDEHAHRHLPRPAAQRRAQRPADEPQQREGDREAEGEQQPTAEDPRTTTARSR
jgi:hypothetical protein